MTDFDAVYVAHASYVRALAARCVGTTYGPDVEQEVWLRAHRHLGEFRGDAAVRSWLHLITLNIVRDLVRRRRRRPDEYSPHDLALAAELPTSEPTPEHHAIDAARSRQLGGVFRSLPSQFRGPLGYWLRGHTLRGIAQRTHMSIGTVKSRLHRGQALVGRHLRRANFSAPQDTV